MTSFFLAAGNPVDTATEAAYMEIRERSRIIVGCAAKPRRIFKLDCRVEGSDCEIEVGQPLPHGGEMVIAILDHGRDESYAVHTGDTADPTRVARPVYSVTDFS